ncbi:hypothetical protein ACNCWW_000617 [Shigella sonnei]
MAKNPKHVLTIETEIKDAQKKLKQLEGQLDGLAEKAGKGIKVNGGLAGGGIAGNIAGSIAGIAELAGSVTKLAGPAGIAVTAALSVKKLTDNIVGMSSELREASAMSGVGIEELQRLTGVMKNVNLTAAQAADVHKDVNEKIYEAVQSGTGEIAGVAQEYRLKFEEISKVMENGGNGIDALAKMYYMIRKEGYTANEAASAISRVSDKGGELAHQFEKMGSEAEYYKQKGEQSITITSDMANKHAEYEKESKKLKDTIDGIKLETLSGLVPLLTDVFNETLTFIQKARAGEGIPGWTMDMIKGGWSLNPTVALWDARNKSKAPLHQNAEKTRQFITDEQWNKLTKEQKALTYTTGQSYYDLIANKSDAQIEAINNALKTRFSGTSDDSLVMGAGEAIVSAVTGGVNWGKLVPVDNGNKLGAHRYKASDGNTYDGYGNAVLDFSTPADGKGLNHHNGTPCSKCGGKKHEGNEKCPVDLAKEAQQRREKEQKQREDALKKLNDLDVKLQGQTAASITSQNKQLESSLKDLDNAVNLGLISQEEAADKRQQLIDQNAANVYKMVLGADPIDALNALTQLQQIRDNELASHKRLLDAKAISYEEYQRRVNDTEQNYSQLEDSLGSMEGFKTNQLMDSFGDEKSNSPFGAFYEIDKEKDQANQDYQSKKLEIDQIKDPAKQYEAQLKLNESYQKKMREIDKKSADARLGVAADMYEGLSGLMSIFGAENSKAMQAAFQAYQAYQIGEATVAMYGAAQDAWAETKGGTGAKMAAAAIAVGQGMANIAKIKATSISGMAHDGIDNIPREGTWLLDKNERVVDSRTNGDLKDFLANQKSGGGNSQPIEVNAPLNINGNVNSSDKMVMEAIKRHAKLVAQAVEDAQRRKM